MGSDPSVLDSVSLELEAHLDRYASRVRAAASRYRLGGAEVDEVIQEVRIRLWQALKEGGNIAQAPASYVYRTAVSAAIDMIRRRRARREVDLQPEIPTGDRREGAARAADITAEENELADIVNQELATLPQDRALAVRMHLTGYPREEIASLLRWSEARTRHLIYRGLEQLRTRLRARGIGAARD